ncbi:MAG TPA: DNA primase, partial [Desulfurococcales archaeon]|nr:DNA primase [Desulfurococcales archaeon]
ITIPSNLDRVETALLAALIEIVDRIGPYSAKISVEEIIDLRAEKIKKIVNRAKDILRKLVREKAPDVKEILREISKSVKPPELVTYGPENLPAGPDIDTSDTIILVEGRADVINLLRYGYTNVIALEGAGSKIPETIIKLCKTKKVIAFLDGDHGGDLILKELLKVAKIDYIARAPPGKEVEELTGKEINKALKNATPVGNYIKKVKGKVSEETQPIVRKEEKAITINIPDNVIKVIKELEGTLKAKLYDEKWNIITEMPVRNLVTELPNIEAGKVYAIVMDGVITQRVIDMALEKNIKVIIGARIGGITKKPLNMIILSFNEVLS